MPFGMDSLSFFGITHSHSVSSGFGSACNRGYSKYETYYYEGNVNTRTVGGSVANMTGRSSDKWSTTYCDKNGIKLGTSVSVGSNGGNGDYGKWETTYYDENGTKLGTSVSVGRDIIAPGYPTPYTYGRYETTYNGGEVSTSRSVGSGYHRWYYEKWETSYWIRPPAPVRKAYNPPQINYNQIWREKIAKEEREKKERIRIAESSVEIPNLKKYYLSQCFFKSENFNASPRIFEDRNGPRERSTVFKELRMRASKNIGGASDKTLRRFGLSYF